MGPLAQLVAHRTFNPLVPGSSPGQPTEENIMSLEQLGDVVLALGLIAAVVIFIRANINYLPREEKIDDKK